MKTYYTVLVFLLTCLSFQMIHSNGKNFLRSRTPKLDLLRGYCVGHKNAPVQLKNFQVKTLQQKISISGKLIVKQDNFTEFQLILKTKRCNSKEALDTCEPMQEITLNKICNRFNETNQIWTPFLNSIDPPFGCPAKIGTYIIQNGTFDVGPFIKFSGAEDWYWKEQAEVYQQDSDVLVACINLEGQIIIGS